MGSPDCVASSSEGGGLQLPVNKCRKGGVGGCYPTDSGWSGCCCCCLFVVVGWSGLLHSELHWVRTGTAVVFSMSGFYEAASCFDEDDAPLRELINSNPELLLRSDRDGLSLLHYACREGHLEAVQLLVEAGVALEAQDRECVRRPSHRALARSIALPHAAASTARLTHDRVRSPRPQCSDTSALGVRHGSRRPEDVARLPACGDRKLPAGGGRNDEHAGQVQPCAARLPTPPRQARRHHDTGGTQARGSVGRRGGVEGWRCAPWQRRAEQRVPLAATLSSPLLCIGTSHRSRPLLLGRLRSRSDRGSAARTMLSAWLLTAA